MPDGPGPDRIRWRVGVAISQIARRWRARLDRRIAPFGLTEARWLVLLSLARRGDGITQKELAARLAIEAPTLVRTLDWLEGQGLVERQEAPNDRRAKTIHLSPSSHPLVMRIEAEAATARGEVLSGIAEADLEHCLRVLEQISAKLTAMEERETDGSRSA